ncbi:MAG TPA: hypothetical protein VEX37_11550 [Thermomicrobiales bacterium]|nr:hypothetical protein [Thermomicrobiales bacterium]
MMRQSPLVRSLLTVAAVILILGPVWYASDHPLTARLTIAFIACWLLAVMCLLAGYTGKSEQYPPEPSEPDKS